MTSTRSLNDRAPDHRSSAFSVRKVAVMAVFIALSVVGALIKIPSPVGSIGLDSAPGYFVAIAFGGVMGAIVIAVGHLLSAGVAGFPLTLPMHLAIAAGMAVLAFIFRAIGKRGTVWTVLAVIATCLLNGFGLGLLLLPVGGTALYLATVPSLLAASAVNLIIAAAAYLAVRNSKLLK